MSIREKLVIELMNLKDTVKYELSERPSISIDEACYENELYSRPKRSN